MSGQPDVVAMSFLYNYGRDNLMLSRQLPPLQADVAPAYDAMLMSRLHPDVATSCLLFLQFLVA